MVSVLRSFLLIPFFRLASPSPPSLYGLPRRAVYAVGCALMAFSVAAASIGGIVGGMAYEDESPAAYWLAERARGAARSIWNFPAAPKVEKAVVAKRVAPKKAAATAGYAAAGSQSICVRTCDGFYFPVGRMGGAQDIAAHETVCQAQCPGATTSLYVMRHSNAIEDAVSVRDGKPYARLASAFLHTKAHDNTCSCKAAGSVIQASVPLSRDITIRRGDSVMTEKGVRIFRGKSGKTPKQTDFVALSQSKDVDPQKRRILAELERVSAPRVAAARPSPANASQRAAQASAPVSRPLFSAPANKSVRLVGPEIPLVR